MTTTVLRPDATTATGGWSLTGAASMHAALSDNSDASYASTWVIGSLKLEMTTQALGAYDVTKSVVSRIRCSQPSGGPSRVGSVVQTPPLTPRATVYVDTTAPIATFAGAAGSINLSSAEVAALQFQLDLYIVNGTVRVYEVYADLVWVTGAVTTITYPTGTPALAVSSLSATWTSVVDADADGSSRDRYRVKVFTAAEYGAGGFDPETSVPTIYDSGDVVSTNQALVIPNLPNLSTMRLYVKVGDSVNGVAHWGAWQGGAGSQFTTSYTTADIASVVGTPDNDNANISVLVTRVTAGPPPTWETVEVERSTDAGASWLPVRAATNVAVSGSTFTVVDYEAPNSVDVLYRARASYVSGSVVVGPWTESTPAVQWTANVDWLKHPTHPSLNRPVTVAANPARTRRRRQGVHSVIGRADPVVVSDVLNLPTGTITFLTATDTEAEALLALLDYDELFFQPRPGARLGEKYIAIGNVEEVPEVGLYNEPGTRWPIAWAEVLIPIDVGQS